MDLIEHLKRQRAFSRANFGPGERTEGVIAHIRKELAEIEQAGSPTERAKEWVDVVILGFDGLLRAIKEAHPHLATTDVAARAAEMVATKQDINEDRDWPDWREESLDGPIEHVRKAG